MEVERNDAYVWSVSFAPQEIFPCEQMNLFILLVISFDVIFLY